MQITLPPPPNKTILCTGQCNIETIALVDRLPPPDTTLELKHFTIQGGGVAATACVTLARLGVNTRFIGKIGDDDNGDQIRRTLEADGVETSRMIVQPRGVTQFSFALVEKGTGRRSTFWTAGSVSEAAPEEIDPDAALEGVDVVFIDGQHPTAQLTLARAAKARGVAVVFGATTMCANAQSLVEASSILIASERFTSQCSGIGRPKDALTALHTLGPEIVVITMGAEGSMGSNGEAVWHQRPGEPRAVVDNVGAGDIYRGAFTYAWAAGADLKVCMQTATAAATLSLQGLGPRANLPGRHDLQQALENLR